MANNDSPWAILSVLLMGVVAGGVGAMILSTDDDGNIKPKIKSRLKMAKAKINSSEGWLKDVSTSTTNDLTEIFADAKTRVNAQVKSLEKRFGKVDKSKYSEAVLEVINQMKAVGEVTREQAKMVKQFLMDDYQLLTAVPKKAGRKKQVN